MTTNKHVGKFEFVLTEEQGKFGMKTCLGYRLVPNKGLILSAGEVSTVKPTANI